MKFLHTMIRVGNLEKSIHFYCEVLNFKFLSQQDHEEGKFSLAFLQASGDENTSAVLELTYNWGVTKYDMGTAYGHVAYEVPSILEVQKNLQKHGYDLSWGPNKSPDGTMNIAFMVDPDGYKIELLEH